jgi:glyoxylase-like metal-dependent hydrolase (beta-lactamase superfamily II)
MPGTSHTALETPIEGLLATPPAALPFLANAQVRSFILERPQGNAIVYNSPGLSEAMDEILALGDATRLLINHAHEAMYGTPRLDVPVFVHERDRAETARGLPVAGTFAHRQMIDDDLEVIPTPGHTPGTTSYLWDSGRHRFLFTGASLWVEHGDWKAVVLGDTDRAAFLDSLRLMSDLDFDVLVPWVAVKGEPSINVVTRDDARRRIAAVIARVEAGGTS